MKILVIEDSPRLLRSLGHGLKRLGHAVDLVADGREGFDYARFNDYGAIVLDLLLPGLDGLTILQNLRSLGKQTPVLILSARGRVEDRVKGLELGADDYLVKPFAFEELAARLDSLARRRHEHRNPETVIGHVAINTAAREVRLDGEPVDLTRSEYALLEYLVMNRGRVRTRDQILDALRESDSFTGSNVVEVLVCTLRRKIGVNGNGSIIKTRRGFGYYVE